MSAAINYDDHRFAIAAPLSGYGWHAVDLESMGSTIAWTRSDEGREPLARELFSVYGMRASVVRKLGPFAYGSQWLRRLRCERCSWVVALNRGTVEQEIDLYTAEAGGTALGDLLRQIFTAILADALPGPEAQPGHRSELLAHTARHRPVLTVCERCTENVPAAAHGPGTSQCPQSSALCEECSFTAGSWAGEWEGVTTGECVVAAPCSTLRALADHYGIVLLDREARW